MAVSIGFGPSWTSADRIDALCEGVSIADELACLESYVNSTIVFPLKGVMVLPPFFIGIDTNEIPYVPVEVTGTAGVEPQTGLLLSTQRSLLPGRYFYADPLKDPVPDAVFGDLRSFASDVILVDRAKVTRLETDIAAYKTIGDPTIKLSWQKEAQKGIDAFASFKFAPKFSNCHSLRHLSSEERVMHHLTNHVTPRSVAAEIYIFHAYLSSLDFPFDAAFYEGHKMRGEVVGVEPLDPAVGVVLRVNVAVLLEKSFLIKEVLIEAKNCFPVLKVVDPNEEVPVASAVATKSTRRLPHATSAGAPSSVASRAQAGRETSANDMSMFGKRVRAFEDYRWWFEKLVLVRATKLDAVLCQWDACFGIQATVALRQEMQEAAAPVASSPAVRYQESRPSSSASSSSVPSSGSGGRRPPPPLPTETPIKGAPGSPLPPSPIEVMAALQRSTAGGPPSSFSSSASSVGVPATLAPNPRQ